ncbi:MAG: undecaprenyldiphospho-muramoylpentapeptide beta-N-acetylglucosaminyltransferase [Acidimicrobiia bacterium]
MTFALITGGGTGGHVYPALALAEELVARGHEPETVHFVGAQRGLEASVVPATGFQIDLLPGRGLERRFSSGAIRALWEAAVAFVRARRIVATRKPRVVVGVGGYASLPCLLAARLRVRRIPAVVHEQNAAPGLANRIAVRLGARAAVSLPGTPLAGAVLTGNPIRAEVARVRRDPHEPLLSVFGGSLGARSLNRAAVGLYDRWRRRTDVSVHHVTGSRDHDDCRQRLDALRRPDDQLRYTLVRYEDDMPGLYTRTTLAACRAGAVTVAELAAAGVPAILVPLPGAPADHQTRNAKAMAERGAAVVVPDSELDAARLDALSGELLTEGTRLDAMSEAAWALARPDAAARLADLVEDVSSRAQR